MNIQRTALHEAGHAVMHAWLRLDNLDRVSVRPDPETQTWGRVRSRYVYALPGFPGWRILSRKVILMMMAGGQAEFLYRRARVAGNGGDWEQATKLAHSLFRDEVRAAEYVFVQEQRARRLIRGPLRRPVEAFAAILVQRVEIDREEAQDLLMSLLDITDYWDRL